MAVLTAKGLSGVSLEILLRKLVLPRTVTMVPGSEFVGPNGGTLTLRVPQPSVARVQASAGAALTADDVTEIPVDVSLSHVYHLKNITDQELTYNLEDFARQITLPQTEAVAVKAEQALLDIMNGLTLSGAAAGPYEIDISAPASGSEEAETRRVLMNAREYLSTTFAPATDRWLACSPDFYSRVLRLLTPLSGMAELTGDALRDAISGRIYGFNVIEVPGMDAGEAVAYHKSAFAWASRVPENPRGATEAFTTTAQGVSMRQIFQYDATKAQDQSLVSTFVGAAAVYEDGTGTNGTIRSRFVKLKYSAA